MLRSLFVTGFVATVLLVAPSLGFAREYKPTEEVSTWVVVAEGGLWCRDPVDMRKVKLVPKGGIILSNTQRTGNIRQLKAGEMWLLTDWRCVVRARTEYIQPKSAQ